MPPTAGRDQREQGIREGIMRALQHRPALTLWTAGCVLAELVVALGKISPL